MTTVRGPVALAIAAALIAFTATPAQGQDPHADHRPCVDNREANSMKPGTRRTVVERDWEVPRMGYHYDMPAVGDLVIYPWCDHPAPGTGDTTQAFVGVVYGGHDGRSFRWLVEWDSRWVPGPVGSDL